MHVSALFYSQMLVVIIRYFSSVCAYCFDNVASGKPTVQSAIGNSAVPGRAVDGNGELIFEGLSCTYSPATSSHPLPWWRVDLQKVVTVEAVTIVNRGFSEFDWRLHNFDIEVFSVDPVENPEANGQMCYSFFGEFGSAVTVTLRCMYPVEGRYVRIKKRQHLNSEDRLTLCEVAVHPKIYENNCSFSQRSPSTFVPYTEMYHTTRARYEIIGSLKTCMIECTMMWACDGFNFNILDSSNGNGTCEFVSVSLAKLYGKPGWTFYKALCSETPAQHV
ncbi:fucolectin-1-like [Haliotis rufescens]|uniref:fucolectin-1-like n=1 Tax=Haliotis rufescens TaxID=6454 RepID=UPI00201F1641|nr:fucolectin-1-like [Haliotis rufescens]